MGLRWLVGKAIIFDVSGHGLGHLSISGPVIDEFTKLFRNVRVVVRSRLPLETIRLFVQGDFEYFSSSGEVTLVAPSALLVDAEASVSAYESLYERWDDEKRRHAAFFREVNPDVVVSNIDYLSLAAAQDLGISTVALCCMNWLDMFRFFCAASERFQDIERLLYGAYAGSGLFLQPKPHMAMDDIGVRRSIGPIARVGQNRARALREIAGVAGNEVVVLHSLGGWPGQSYAALPRIDGVKWLVAGDDSGSRSDIFSCRLLRWSFADIVASVDVAVGKDSYGTVVEAACSGIPLVMAPRGDWPEEECLVEWASKNCCFVTSDDRMGGGGEGLRRAVERILVLDRRPAVPANGIRDAIEAIASVGML